MQKRHEKEVRRRNITSPLGATHAPLVCQSILAMPVRALQQQLQGQTAAEVEKLDGRVFPARFSHKVSKA